MGFSYEVYVSDPGRPGRTRVWSSYRLEPEVEWLGEGRMVITVSPGPEDGDYVKMIENEGHSTISVVTRVAAGMPSGGNPG